jgi:hypothetical protein
MKTPLLLAGLTAVSLLMNVCLAKANIGDTLTQSNARYGEPWRQHGNLYYYVTGGYLIAELVSQSTGAVAESAISPSTRASCGDGVKFVESLGCLLP